MLTVHHLETSRSIRVLWLLEELELPYRVVGHRRDSRSRLAPPSLEAVHPLGKAPVLEDGDRLIIESGAIIDYIVRRHGNGRLAPDPATPAYDEYQQWLHYAEGSAMLPLMLKLYTSVLGGASAALDARIDSELRLHLGFVERAVTATGYLVASRFSAADIQMSFVTDMLNVLHLVDRFPSLMAWGSRLRERPAFERAARQEP